MMIMEKLFKVNKAENDLPTPSVVHKFFKHVKTGNVYEMLMITNTTCKDTTKFPQTVVYKDVETDKLYSRPFDKFVSKFEAVI
jgi:hypothetical protein